MSWPEYQNKQCISDYYHRICRQNPDFEIKDYKSVQSSSSSKDFSINDRSIKPIDEIDYDFDFIIDPDSCMYRCC